MARIVNRMVTVEQEEESGEPIAFVDREHRYIVMSIEDYWKESGEWWNGEPQRTMYRVMTTDVGMGPGLFDLEHAGEEWRIYRVWD